MIYLASPYTSSQPGGMKNVQELFRYFAALDVAKKMIENGQMVFSPIVYSHHIYKESDVIGGDYAQWKEFSRKMIEVCDEVVVLMLRGWNSWMRGC